MIKKMTDEILDNPKDRDAKQKSQDEAVNACKFRHAISREFQESREKLRVQKIYNFLAQAQAFTKQSNLNLSLFQ